MCTKMRSRKIFLYLLLLVTALDFVKCDNLNLNKTNNENLTSQLISCNDGEKCQSISRDQVLLVHKFDDYVRETSSILNSHNMHRMKHSSVIYGLVSTAEENQLNQQCYNEIMQIYHGINRKEIWAMKSELKR